MVKLGNMGKKKVWISFNFFAKVGTFLAVLGHFFALFAISCKFLTFFNTFLSAYAEATGAIFDTFFHAL